jgi:hypothetical protein
MSTITFEVGGRDHSPLAPDEAPVLGRDILFTHRLEVGGAGDYLTTEGAENLRAAILRRLLVAPSEYKLRPDYGVGVRLFLKRPATTANIDELKRRIRDQLARERRIERVLDVEVAPQDINGLRVYVITIAVVSAGREQRFRPFTISDEA